MLQILRNAWKIIDLRKKLLYTLLIVFIFRLGSAIPVPFLDMTNLAAFAESLNADGNLLGFMNMLTGDSFSKATLFALSIQPYINASIIVQLLAVAIPALQRWSKEEGEEGRRKINKLNRIVTLVLALMMAVGYYFTLKSSGIVKYTGSGFEGWFAGISIVLSFVAGSSIIVWLGELINKKGIGNGISIILFAGIVSQLPAAATNLWKNFIGEGITNKILVPVIIILAVVVVGFIVLMSDAERRIPVQYAKRVVGRKQYGGQSSYIPIKVNMSGVMPIIFASSIVSLPGIIISFFQIESDFWSKFLSIFNYNTALYAVVYFIFIIIFNYFYVSIQYNPIEMANNLKRNNGAIPGYRAGKPTSDYIMKVLSKIILIGALFLGFIAVFPIALGWVAPNMNIALGGTTVLIVVGVALETTKTLESQMMMRHYKGFLE